MTAVGIVGSRGFANAPLVRAFVRRTRRTTCIVSGACPNSPDHWAVREAIARGQPYQELPADWDRYGKSAGFRRNVDIVAQSDHVVAFWDGVSEGTLNTIALALLAATLYRVYDTAGAYLAPEHFLRNPAFTSKIARARRQLLERSHDTQILLF